MTKNTNIEIRVLPMPDGTHRPFQGYELLWQAVDYLQEIHDVDVETLVKLTHINMEEIGYNFEESFPNVVAYVRQEYDKATDQQSLPK